MKNRFKLLLLVLCLFVFGIANVHATVVVPDVTKSFHITEEALDEMGDDGYHKYDQSYIIGTHLFTFEGNPNSEYQGFLKMKFILRAATTIESENLDDYIIYYVKGNKLTDSITGEEFHDFDMEIHYVDLIPLDNDDIDENIAVPEISVTNYIYDFDKTLYQDTDFLVEITPTSSEADAFYQIAYAPTKNGRYSDNGNTYGQSPQKFTVPGKIATDAYYKARTCVVGDNDVVKCSNWSEVLKVYKEAATGDLNLDGVVDEKDIRIMQLYIDGKIDSIPYVSQEYTITYNLDGGTVSGTNPTSYKIEDDITIVDPTKDGYTFVGWTGSNGDTPQKNLKMDYGTTGNLEFTANWTLDSYNITYDLGTTNYNPVNHPENPSTYNVEQSITLKDASREESLFIGWTKGDETEPVKNYVIPAGTKGDLAFTAHFILLGDYNNNGSVDIQDSTVLQTYIENRDRLTPEEIAFIEQYGDLNGDGLVDYIDRDVLRNAIAGNALPYTGGTYTITYYLDGGTTSETLRDRYTKVTIDYPLPEPTKDGYTFVGWTGSNGNTPQTSVKIEYGSTGNKVFTANWTLTHYPISYYLNGGAANNPSTYTMNDEIHVANPTKDGYKFIGWALGSNPSSSENPVKDYTIERGTTGYIELYAIYKLYGDIDGNNNIDGFDLTIYDDYIHGNQLTTEQQAAIDSVGDLNGNGVVNIVDYDILEAKLNHALTTIPCECEEYTISYELEGGEIDTVRTLYTNATSAFILEHPTKEGYSFAGWTGSNGDVPEIDVTVPQSVTGTLSYTATWTPINYEILYDLNGGTNNTNNPGTYTIADKVVLKEPTKTGYTFTGWTGSNGTTPQKSVTIQKGSTGEKQYVAHWMPTVYTISYTLNGGTVDGNLLENYTIESNDFVLPDPTKDYYTFTGWTGSNGDTPEKNLTIPNGSTGDLEFTANWTPIEYTISYIFDEQAYDAENNIENPATYNVEQTFTLKDPTREMSKFIGWTKGDETEPVKNYVIPVGTTGNLTFTAHFEAYGDMDRSGLTNEADVPYYQNYIYTPSNLSANVIEYITNHGDLNEDGVVDIVDYDLIKSYLATEFNFPYTETTYTITYTLDGGELNTKRNKYVEKSLLFTLDKPTRDGYVFIGWTGSNGNTPVYDLNIPNGSTGNKEYTANWMKDDFSYSTAPVDQGISPQLFLNIYYENNLMDTDDILEVYDKNGETLTVGRVNDNGVKRFALNSSLLNNNNEIKSIKLKYGVVVNVTQKN